MSDGWGQGYEAGADWAARYEPWVLVSGFPAWDNVKQSGFPSDVYAQGYFTGVWAYWCQEHQGDRCFATEACRNAIILRASEGQHG